MIAPDCKVVAAIVFPQGTDIEALKNKVEEITEKYGNVSVRFDGIDDADYSDPDGELARIIGDAAESLDRRRPLMTPDIALSDCRYWRSRSIPAYWYGPGGDLCSAGDEHVTIEDLIHTVKVHTLACMEYLAK